MIVTRPAADAIAAAFEKALPGEAAGFLLGHDMIATEVVAAPAGGGVGGFSVPDHEVRRVAEGARLRDLHIVALFHSHPSGATALSDSDAAALRYSEWPWIVATRPPGESQIQLTAYQPATTRSVKCSIASSRVE